MTSDPHPDHPQRDDNDCPTCLQLDNDPAVAEARRHAADAIDQLQRYWELRNPSQEDWDRLVSPLYAINYFNSRGQSNPEYLEEIPREVGRALGAGHSWQEIGRELLISAEDAKARYGLRTVA